MSESVNTNELNEQTKRLNEASKYTDGDIDKAREMISGNYKDINVVKGKFAIEDAELYGFFAIFLKVDNESVSNITLYVLSSSEIYNKIKLTDSWKLYYKSINEAVSEQEISEVDDLIYHLADSAKGYDLFSYSKDDDGAAIEDILIENFRKYYNLPSIDCSVEIDNASSLEIAEAGVSIESYVRKKKQVSASEKEQDVPEIENEYDLKINAKVIVSPVKGKYVNDISQGEMLKLIPLKDDPISKKVAAAQRTLDENGKIKFLRGKLKEKIKLEDGGYILYCLVANNVLAKIIEEENVKIELFSHSKGKEKLDDGSKSNLILYVAMLAGLLILTVLVIMLLL